ncbi:MAG: alpha/beta fold hydrolase [Bacteroidota bacterium]
MDTIQTNKSFRIEEQSAPAPFTSDFVISRDGTRIDYLQLGHGPGVVMLHGAMESARSHLGLASGLTDAFTIYLPERRGHQLGVPFVNEYSMQKEIEDLGALLDRTGARNIFGVSAGGLICLQAALDLPSVNKVAVYEPALIVNGSASIGFLTRYDQEISQGKTAAALVSGMKGAQLGPPIFNAIPRWLLESLTALTMKQEEKKAGAGDTTMRSLAPTLHYDFQLVAEMAEMQKRFGSVQPDVLLLGGNKSPAWLKIALDALARTLPHVQRIEFPGLDHGGSSDLSSTNRSGQPEVVAAELRRFFV